MQDRRNIRDTDSGAGSSGVRVKICGITDRREIDVLIESGAAYAGFVLYYPKSRRNNTIEQASELVDYMLRVQGQRKDCVKAVAVTVSPTAEQLREIEKAKFDILQVHGSLSDEVKEKCHMPIWRAFNLTANDDIACIKAIEAAASDENITGIVLDGAAAGSGETFSWDCFQGIDMRDKLFVMAGGLTVQNVRSAVQKLQPDVADVSSGVEYDDRSIRGKDLDKIREFIREAECLSTAGHQAAYVKKTVQK